MIITITIDTDVDRSNALAEPTKIRTRGNPTLKDVFRLRGMIHQRVDEYFDELEQQPKAEHLNPQ